MPERVGGIASPLVFLRVMSGTSPELPRRRGCFAVTMADFRSSSAGGGATFASLAVRTITGTSGATAFFFLGGRL